MEDEDIRKAIEEEVGKSENLDASVSDYFSSLALRRKRAVQESGLSYRELEIVELSAKGMSPQA